MFIVELPIVRPDEAHAVNERRRATDAPASLSGMDIVVVDDDAETLRFLTRVLQRAGAAVRAAESVDDALREIATKRPDVIVSDIAMPERDGYDLAREVRRRDTERRIPMIAVTASGTDGDRERALSAGFDHYLRKPITPNALVATVARASAKQPPA